MVVVMAPEATQADVDGIVDVVRDAGGEAFVTRGVSRTIVGLVGDVDQFGSLNLRSRPGVLDVVRISVPYKLVSREHHPHRSVVEVGGVPIGPDTMTVIAGPCAVESPEQTLTAARMAKAAGEMSHWPEYDYVIVNRDKAEAFAEVRAILAAERLKRERQIGLSDFVRALQAKLK